MSDVETVWSPLGPQQFVDRRTRLTNSGRQLVRQNVRAFHGVVVRKGERGRPIYDSCPHAHNKQSAARVCAEQAARRLNRALAKGETWPLTIGKER